MSTEPLPPKTDSAFVRFLMYAAIGVIVVVLQVALPWISYRCGGTRYDELETFFDSPNKYGFWSSHLRFDGFLDPRPPMFQKPLSFASATVCKGELIVLMGRREFFFEPVEVVRVNLRTGRLTTSSAPPDLRHVLSNGQTIWWLPDPMWPLPEGKRVTNPFVFHDQPASIVNDVNAIGGFQLMEFIDGHWRASDQYALLPNDFFQSETEFIQQRHGQVHLLECISDDMYFRVGLETGSEQQAIEFSRHSGRSLHWSTNDQLRESGWNRIRFYTDRREQFQNPFDPFTPFGHWFENDLPCAIYVNPTEDGRIGEFRWFRYLTDGRSELTILRSAIRWGQNTGGGVSFGGWLHVVASQDGNVFILSHTFGKWLLGVKVLRTTLRPCGLAPSVLREILFIVESLMLLSWVPGVISTLAARHSQRIGDLLADTIVIREESPSRKKPAAPK